MGFKQNLDKLVLSSTECKQRINSYEQQIKKAKFDLEEGTLAESTRFWLNSTIDSFKVNIQAEKRFLKMNAENISALM